LVVLIDTRCSKKARKLESSGSFTKLLTRPLSLRCLMTDGAAQIIAYLVESRRAVHQQRAGRVELRNTACVQEQNLVIVDDGWTRSSKLISLLVLLLRTSSWLSLVRRCAIVIKVDSVNSSRMVLETVHTKEERVSLYRVECTDMDTSLLKASVSSA
jgi:hypothetical protein